MSRIFIIRHAEKPAGSIKGVNDSGSQDPESLTPRGWQRAGALAVFFGSKQGLKAPGRIYASASSTATKSDRPLETIGPLAAKLGIKPILKYTKGEEEKLAAEITKRNGTTLVCWQHEDIAAIAKSILGAKAEIPSPWPAHRFDVVWCFRRSGKRKKWEFSQVCQLLLKGDEKKPIVAKQRAVSSRKPR
jgi:broad specificity phosphatase PhoE